MTTTQKRKGSPSGLPPFIMSDQDIRDLDFDFEEVEGTDQEDLTITLRGQWERRSDRRWVFCVISQRVEAPDGSTRYYPAWTDTVAEMPDGSKATIRIQATIEAYGQKPKRLPRDRDATQSGPTTPDSEAMDSATSNDDGKLHE